MNPFLQMIINRLKEPSSHAGVAAMLQGAKMVFPEYSVFFDVGSMLFGGIAAVSKG